MRIDTMLDINYGTLTPLVGIQKWLLGYKKRFPLRLEYQHGLE